ncbi:MAG: hypothetical protein PVF93_05550 [Chromatiaceae bacterium]
MSKNAGVARALATIERLQRGWLERSLLPGRRVSKLPILCVHPDTERRIAHLMSLKPQLPESTLFGQFVETNAKPALIALVTCVSGFHIDGLRQ